MSKNFIKWTAMDRKNGLMVRATLGRIGAFHVYFDTIDLKSPGAEWQRNQKDIEEFSKIGFAIWVLAQTEQKHDCVLYPCQDIRLQLFQVICQEFGLDAKDFDYLEDNHMRLEHIK